MSEQQKILLQVTMIISILSIASNYSRMDEPSPDCAGASPTPPRLRSLPIIPPPPGPPPPTPTVTPDTFTIPGGGNEVNKLTHSHMAVDRGAGQV